MHAVLFDIDGTLVDSNHLHVLAWQRAFRAIGREFSLAAIHRQIGKGGDQLVPALLPAEEARRHQAALERLHGELFAREYLPLVKPFAGVRELFVRLRRDGVKVLLASSSKSSEVARHVKLLGVADLIEGATSADDVERSKPCPDVFRAALDRIRAPRAIVVGDTPYDAAAACKAGLPSLGVLTGGFAGAELRAAGALAVFRDIADLLGHYDALLDPGEVACASAGKASSIPRKTRRTLRGSRDT